MLQFPYGIADFHRIRRDDLVYLDRTSHIRDLETLGSALVFLRPRRFGKSLWLQTLANYYDVRLADEFESLFGDLDIGRRPTPRRNRYFVLQWNFSEVDPRGRVEDIGEALREHVATQAEAFARRYRTILPEPIKVEGSPQAMLSRMLSVVRETPYMLYLLIDEYDNFVNEVMASDVPTYRALFGKDGPFKLLFKSVKSALEGKGMERVFVTGVSPVAMNDLTSGFNNAEDVSLEPALASLCGFSENEIRDLLERIAAERALSGTAIDESLDIMRSWYNGYRFSEGETELVYNPTNVLYFLKRLHLRGKPPRKLHDENLRTDRGKLVFVARTAAGSGVIRQLTEGDGGIDVPRLEASFSIDDLTSRLEKDKAAVASFLYYMGMLTLAGVPDRLRIPNLVVRKLFLDRLLEIYLPDLAESSQAREVAMGFFQDGDLEPLLAFFEEKLLPTLSNRDRGAKPRKQGLSGSGVNEMVVKALFLAILFDDTRYVIASELEVERTYIDLCLLVRDEVRRSGFFDILFEFKLVRRHELGRRGRELRDMKEDALRRLTPVAKAFQEARNQVDAYREALRQRRGDALRLRGYVVVAVGLERILGEEATAG